MKTITAHLTSNAVALEILGSLSQLEEKDYLRPQASTNPKWRKESQGVRDRRQRTNVVLDRCAAPCLETCWHQDAATTLITVLVLATMRHNRTAAA